MTGEEFGGLAPSELAELIEVWEERERRADFRAGQICFVLSEINRDRKRRVFPFHPADFFPSLDSLRPEGLDDDDLEAKLDIALGGRR